jgi:hypothetical protein
VKIGLPQGLKVLKIFKAYRHGTSILDDFDFYEENGSTGCARKGINADSLHEARLSYYGTDDLKSMVCTFIYIKDIEEQHLMNF